MKKILLVLCAITLMCGCSKEKDKEFDDMEKSFKDTVAKYYETNLRNVVYPPYTCEKITLSDMKAAGVDVSQYEKEGCKVDDVAAFVVVTDASNKSDIKYDVVPNLSCGKYSSEVSDKMKDKYQCIALYFSK